VQPTAPQFATLALALAASVAAAPSEPIVNAEHILTTLADGVYAIRHKRAAEVDALSGNTTVVVGEREVLVVDATSAPQFARADLEQIRRWTDKPIRYLVNTHWHGDHTWGNGAYAEAVPGLAIVGHRETRRLVEGYLPHFSKRMLDLPDVIRRLLASGKNESGEPLTDEEIASFKANMANFEQRAQEFRSVVVRPPDLTFERELDLDLGNRRVQLRHFGRGNTSGDLVVHLPDEHIVVAGDLLVYPLPFLMGGFPGEWSRTLDAVAALAPETIVPGHGAVLAGDVARGHLALVRDLLATVARLVQRESFRLGNESRHFDEVLAAVRGDPEIAGLRARFAAANPEYGPWLDSSLSRVVTAAYREAWGN